MKCTKIVMDTEAINGGRLKPHKGVNLPNVKLKISAMTAKDRADLAFATNTIWITSRCRSCGMPTMSRN